MRMSLLFIFLTTPFSLAVQGCSVVPFYEYPNDALKEEPAAAVGTYNASLNIPWNYDLTQASRTEAAACRRYLASGRLPPGQERTPCAGVPRDRNFVGLAVSGGGSRSAAMAAAVILELERIGVMRHVDVISAVSGGAQAAALYGLTHDEADAKELETLSARYVLKPEESANLVGVFERNLTADWLSSLFMPWHFGPYLVTSLDRTDVMADTFADNYYPRGGSLDINWGQRFRDLNPKRPSLLLNATDMTLRRNAGGVPSGIAGECFTFSYEAFRLGLKSDLHELPISQAVMASSAYPGVFNYLSIRDYARELPKEKEAYIHLADGGIRDHLALVPLSAMLRRFAIGQSLVGLGAEELVRACEFSRGTLDLSRALSREKAEVLHSEADPAAPLLPEKILLIVIDAGQPPQGYPEDNADPRATFFDRVVPVKKVIDSVDATLDDQRALRVVELITLRRHLTGKSVFEKGIQDCLRKTRGGGGELTACLERIRVDRPNSRSGVFGPECCPIIGLGTHDFTKFADQEFGPLNSGDLDSGEVWGADHITLECLADNDYGRGRPDSLYAKVRRMDIALSLTAEELKTISVAATALVEEMSTAFCDAESGLLAGLPGIACTPARDRQQAGCDAGFEAKPDQSHPLSAGGVALP